MTPTAPISLTNLRPASGHRESQPSSRWSVDDVEALYATPFMDLVFRAQQVHLEHFDANEVQLSTLLSIKTGGCAEDCAYCPQSAHHDTGLPASKLMAVEAVLAERSEERRVG